MSRGKITTIIYDTIDEINDENPYDMRLNKSPNTIISGDKGKLDSLGVINFIITLEEKIDKEFNKIINLQNEDLLLSNESPLEKVESLIDYLLHQIND